ncbi:MAG: class I SAM-dependent methyltransferase [Acidimicrobiales bacterium]
MAEQFELLVDLHVDGERQGPGSDEATRRAVGLAGLEDATDLTIADIGCGTGAPTLVLAHDLDAQIAAVDLFRPFLADLDETAGQRGLSDRITTSVASMDDLTFDDESLDVIWSEGAIYNIGFKHGIRSWRRYLKPGGVLAVSEITWLTQQRPEELEEHWATAYPEVGTASAKLAVLESAGYTPTGYFALPETCWLDHYYRPLQGRFDAFLDRHDHSAAAKQVVEAERHEIDLYERFSSFVSYGFYIAARGPD